MAPAMTTVALFVVVAANAEDQAEDGDRAVFHAVNDGAGLIRPAQNDKAP